MKVGVIGLGYVGLPLAVAFAEAAAEVVGVDVDAGHGRRARARRVDDRGHPVGAPDAPRRRAPRPSRPITRRSRTATRSSSACPPRSPISASPTSLTSTPRATPSPRSFARASSSSSNPPPTPARPASAWRRSSRSRASRRATDFHLAFSPERIDPGRTDFTVRTTPKVVGGLTEACCERRGRALRPDLRPRRRRLEPRGRRAHEAPREHLPLGQHRARQRARDPRRPDGHRRLGGRSRPPRPSRSASCASIRARAWAATACRSTPSTSPSRLASTTSRPSSSSSRAGSTRRSRSSASSARCAR